MPNPRSALAQAREAMAAQGETLQVDEPTAPAAVDGDVGPHPKSLPTETVAGSEQTDAAAPVTDPGRAESTPAEPSAAAAAAAPAKPLFKGKREIADAEGLVDYAGELERRQIELEAQLGTLQALQTQSPTLPATAPVASTPTSASPIPAGPPLDFDQDQFFVDPKGAMEKLTKGLQAQVQHQAGEVVKQVLNQRAETERYWSQFYTDNPDLRGQEELVELIAQRVAPVVAKMPRAQAQAHLVAEIKRLVGQARTPARVIQPGAAAVPATRSPAPKVTQKQEPVAPMNFVDQVKAQRDARARKKGA